ncbi:hypothetical protein [Mesorhizobium sp. B4-1-4]|uniref:hypothetical protein n=1 Tax=Mesorhizobium sp. B4-1-4 TaxID=2589888 RepID=UPI00112DA060|nr:hypothetical protein [Mesorhizobium sp. B4-1-4]UCI30508.1 hypothetical protein FJW03_22255 [Mesorhizobium sp. B4-1-4]
MNLRPYMFTHPRPCILVCSDSDLHFFVWAKDFNKKHGPYAAKRRAIPTFTALQFGYGWQEAAVKPSAHNMLEISSKALLQLMVWYGRTNGNEFTGRNLHEFFEGNELNAVARYFQHVALPILQGSSGDLGSVQQYSMRRDAAFLNQLTQ